jgi:hypothetical protein
VVYFFYTKINRAHSIVMQNFFCCFFRFNTNSSWDALMQVCASIVGDRIYSALVLSERAPNQLTKLLQNLNSFAYSRLSLLKTLASISTVGGKSASAMYLTILMQHQHCLITAVGTNIFYKSSAE